MRRSLIYLLLLVTLPAVAQIYKYTDANGNPAYSNQPPNGTPSQTVDLPPLNTVDAKKLTEQNNDPTSGQKIQPSSAYSLLELTNLPTDEALRANNGTFSVGVAIQPRLQPGHLLQMVVDGMNYGQATNVPRLQVVNLERGEHSLAVRVMSGDRIIQQSSTVTTTVQRVHLGKP
ncbi:DUF4124 domain-containing protein [Pseudomonas sp. 10B1]|uniref:DUF4124 domain-containing protein n=1 Tax=unclassified Pseudomonas TaxID=196821 RepID=UPI002AB56556|nr:MULTISPECIES: DUF4124 domain-containing protein [unclassified Pseudomonas]MDY7562366.1 DUF4124 domain-containing protein [Pseudomonas sp. AB6]MEA9976401.1 DUF4124 domain-containing protein [Pseudomonas sp. RTS4]MEA9994710.1 DUF4124 domain-containing protein [Pseudomonas sp. AA4]MEB0086373.1 DUF4124 domain-containing protein [Pseudomonas sp. RTI1]MEB0126428.1 DUF4124 domain-containing protein [Pseudomonas sp. CCC1.2]